jgi:hypothetical protein
VRGELLPIGRIRFERRGRFAETPDLGAELLDHAIRRAASAA